MKTKFTPGPWRITNGYYPATIAVVIKDFTDWRDEELFDLSKFPKGFFIHMCEFNKTGEETAKANAQLIAAAPEMYEALDKALIACRHIEKQYENDTEAWVDPGTYQDCIEALQRGRSALKKARGES